MKARKTLDEMDRSILRILSTYEHLTPLQLWYELGEDDAVKEMVTEEEILRRLESLKARGFVEVARRRGADDDADYPGYRVKPTRARAGEERKRP